MKENQKKIESQFIQIILMIILFTLTNTYCHIENDPVIKFCNKVEQRIQPDVLAKFISRSEDDRNHLDYFEKFKKVILEELKNSKEVERIFLRNEVENENDKAYILFMSIHRKNNDKEIHFDDLIQKTKIRRIETEESQKEFSYCKEMRKNIARDNYNKINEGDIIRLSYPYYRENDYKNAFLYDCPSKYDNKEDEYVFITGKIIGKFEEIYSANSKSLFFKVKVLNNSNESIPILMQWKRKHDTISVDLESYGREITKIKK